MIGKNSTSSSAFDQNLYAIRDLSSDEPKKVFRMKIRRMRVKRSVRRSGRRPSTFKKYQVQVVIKETPIEAFVDTGADICIMSKRRAKRQTVWIEKDEMLWVHHCHYKV